MAVHEVSGGIMAISSSYLFRANLKIAECKGGTERTRRPGISDLQVKAAIVLRASLFGGGEMDSFLPSTVPAPRAVFSL